MTNLIAHPCPTVPTSFPGEPPVTIECEHPELMPAVKDDSLTAGSFVWIVGPALLAILAMWVIRKIQRRQQEEQ